MKILICFKKKQAPVTNPDVPLSSDGDWEIERYERCKERVCPFRRT